MYELGRPEIYMASILGLTTLATLYLAISFKVNPPKYKEDFDEGRGSFEAYQEVNKSYRELRGRWVRGDSITTPEWNEFIDLVEENMPNVLVLEHRHELRVWTRFAYTKDDKIRIPDLDQPMNGSPTSLETLSLGEK